RGRLCRDLDLPEGELPFAGELIQVRDDQRRWEGAVERLLHSFGLSLLVPDRRYVQVAQWVDRTDLRGRLVYFRVRGGRREPRDLRPDSLVRKIVVNPDSPFSEWLEREIAARFDIACCDNPEVFRRETDAITPAGQIKRGGKRHEKDDRHRIDDRSRYILGWSNEAKIAALERDAAAAHRRTREVETQLQGLQRKQQKERARFDGLSRLAEYRDFRELDWRTPVLEIRRLEEERRQLEESSDILQRLNGQLQRLEERLAEDEERLEKARDKRSRTAQRYGEAQRQLEETKARTAETEGEHRERFGRVAALLPEALGDMTLTVERCDDAERTVRAWLQNRIDSVDRRAQSLRDRIIDAMRSYCTLYPLDTEETDVAIEAAGEYRAMLERLREDDLPRFRGALQGAFEREHHPRGGQLPGPAGQTAGDHQGADRPDQPLPHRHRLQSGALHRP
ncbi:MAG: hypothetical protein K9L28_06140, partial [Synergistales bacterium]|nr:hypothetical protein [Synergistales bacterium]